MQGSLGCCSSTPCLVMASAHVISTGSAPDPWATAAWSTCQMLSGHLQTQHTVEHNGQVTSCQAALCARQGRHPPDTLYEHLRGM